MNKRKTGQSSVTHNHEFCDGCQDLLDHISQLEERNDGLMKALAERIIRDGILEASEVALEEGA